MLSKDSLDTRDSNEHMHIETNSCRDVWDFFNDASFLHERVMMSLIMKICTRSSLCTWLDVSDWMTFYHMLTFQIKWHFTVCRLHSIDIAWRLSGCGCSIESNYKLQLESFQSTRLITSSEVEIIHRKLKWNICRWKLFSFISSIRRLQLKYNTSLNSFPISPCIYITLFLFTQRQLTVAGLNWKALFRR